MREYYVKHKESNTVRAENKEEAEQKAIHGDTELQWETVGYEVLKVGTNELTDAEKVERVENIIRRYDDLDDDMDMDSAITLIRDIVIDGDDE